MTIDGLTFTGRIVPGDQGRGARHRVPLAQERGHDRRRDLRGPRPPTARLPPRHSGPDPGSAPVTRRSRRAGRTHDEGPGTRRDSGPARPATAARGDPARWLRSSAVPVLMLKPAESALPPVAAGATVTPPAGRGWAAHARAGAPGRRQAAREPGRARQALRPRLLRLQGPVQAAPEACRPDCPTPARTRRGRRRGCRVRRRRRRRRHRRPAAAARRPPASPTPAAPPPTDPDEPGRARRSSPTRLTRPWTGRRACATSATCRDCACCRARTLRCWSSSGSTQPARRPCSSWTPP